MDIQSRINSGEIQLEDQHASYERDKEYLEREMKKRALERQKHRKCSKQTPSFETIFKKYGQVSKSTLNETGKSMPFHTFVNDHMIHSEHPIVCQDAEEEDSSSGLLGSFGSALKYAEFGTVFFWELQAATIG